MQIVVFFHSNVKRMFIKVEFFIPNLPFIHPDQIRYIYLLNDGIAFDGGCISNNLFNPHY